MAEKKKPVKAFSSPKLLYAKSEAALLAAIEIYNKPNFLYREELFAILIVNAWELFLKAKILKINNNKLNTILACEHPKKKDGSRSKARVIKRNRSGQPMTIDIFSALKKLSNQLPNNLRNNIEAMIEIRDNAIHFRNENANFAALVHGYCQASVKNYVELAKRWMGKDFSEYNIYLLPIGFIVNPSSSALNLGVDDGLLKYLSDLSKNEAPDANFSIKLSLEVNLKKTSSAITEARLTNDPNAQPVRLVRENFREFYPWTFKKLVEQIKIRYIDFVQNKHFYTLLKEVKKDSRCCYIQYLDPEKTSGSSKPFFNQQALQLYFDKQYKIKQK